MPWSEHRFAGELVEARELLHTRARRVVAIARVTRSKGKNVFFDTNSHSPVPLSRIPPELSESESRPLRSAAPEPDR